jgi:hypothetical protein
MMLTHCRNYMVPLTLRWTTLTSTCLQKAPSSVTTKSSFSTKSLQQKYNDWTPLSRKLCPLHTRIWCWVTLPRAHHFFTSRTTDILASDTEHNLMCRNNYGNPFVLLQPLLTLQIPMLLFKPHCPKDKFRSTNPSVPTLWTNTEGGQIYRRGSETDREVRYICYASSHPVLQIRDVRVFKAIAAEQIARGNCSAST